jgi:hypothetical protein
MGVFLGKEIRIAEIFLNILVCMPPRTMEDTGVFYRL